MFNLFTKNQESMTPEMFRNAVQSVKAGHSLDEINIFIDTSDLFNRGEKGKITRKEFVDYFSKSMLAAFKVHDDQFLRRDKTEVEAQIKTDAVF